MAGPKTENAGVADRHKGKAVKALSQEKKVQSTAAARTNFYLGAATVMCPQDSDPEELVATHNQLQENAQGFTQRLLEQRLTTQIATLDSLFYNFASSFRGCRTLEAQTRLLELALRCQEQSRRTIATLDNVRNPKKPSQFIKNYVDKQVNQLKVEQQPISSDRSLEASTYAAMDSGSERTAAAVDPELEALAVVNRTNHI